MAVLLRAPARPSSQAGTSIEAWTWAHSSSVMSIGQQAGRARSPIAPNRWT
ncbi:hypothetical protein ABZ281_32625 [Streptomyces sp. NPDC006265]|uniref:hypothetical protein n=1 Tax=Streptomyces sp. NPDC006265 TaxID=3156740 RepID=UPI0033AE1219